MVRDGLRWHGSHGRQSLSLNESTKFVRLSGLEDQKPPKKKKRNRKTQHNPNGIVKTKR